MKTNKQLCEAKRAKNDEFYTQLSDIEKELQHYTEHFNNKVVLCNCNDARYGYFQCYFTTHFKELNLKELICTAYGDNAFYTSFDGIAENRYELTSNGDFRSDEMIELLKRADIVCTNPPFSLFREYVAQLMAFDKKFLIIGNMNAITYKEVFPLIKENRLWCGVRKFSGGMDMILPKEGFDMDLATTKNFSIDDNGNNLKNIMGCIWFTNLDNNKRHTPLDLYKRYSAEEYPKYDNYDAIEVSKVADIPMDYNGVMGVPISFLDKYCPNQFEIIGITENADYLKNLYIDGYSKYHRGYINGKPTYARILIKRR